MKRRDFLRGTAALGATGAATLAGAPSASAQTTVNDVAQDVRCYCGCGDILAICDCEDAVNGEAYIQDKLNQGMSKQEVIDAYVQQFTGPMNSEYNLRASVAKEGRGLSLWILPPVAVVVGAAAFYFFLKRGMGQDTSSSSTSTTPCPDCGEAVPTGAKFCTGCGSEMPKSGSSGTNFCPSCGEKAGEGAFCTSCGEQL